MNAKDFVVGTKAFEELLQHVPEKERQAILETLDSTLRDMSLDISALGESSMTNLSE